MGFSMELRRLGAEHQQLRHLSDALLAIIACGEQASLQKLQPIWQEFHMVLTRHLKCEDWILYPRLTASMDANVARVAQDLFREVGGLSAQLQQFDATWDETACLSDPQAYLAAMRSILQAVDHRTECEEHELFPVAAGTETDVPQRGLAVHGVDLMPSLA